MEYLSGCMTARLADRNEKYERKLLEQINRRINPPKKIKPGEIYIRAMYIVSDQVNSQGGRFAKEELDRLVELIVDSPVMVGHQRDSLPLARNFMALKVEVDGRIWVKSYFYWMKDSEGAEDLRKNIDGGIYKECSVSFLFNLPQCSICKKDIRGCRHIPFREYEVSPGKNEIAHFLYRNIERVLETSLVFRGAIPDTRITDELSPDDDSQKINNRPITARHFFKISESSAPCNEHRRYGRAKISVGWIAGFTPYRLTRKLYLSPYQPGISLSVIKKSDVVEIESNTNLPDQVRQYVAKSFEPMSDNVFAFDVLMYAVRGKDRLNGLSLMNIINSSENLHRLRFKICDVSEFDEEDFTGKTYGERLSRVNEIMKQFSSELIAAKKVRIISRDEYDKASITAECSEYNYGIEMLAEEEDGTMIRHILTQRSSMAAVFDKISPRGRSNFNCEMRPIEQDSKILKIKCPRSDSLQAGMVAIIYRKIAAPGKRGIWHLADILPAVDTVAIRPGCDPAKSSRGKMHIVCKKDMIRLFYIEDNKWRAVEVHHYSLNLFKKGRRFVADDIDEKKRLVGPPPKESVPLDAVTVTGKMRIFNLAADSDIFGDKKTIWLRPVILDGVERHLFYGREANRPQEEL